MWNSNYIFGLLTIILFSSHSPWAWFIYWTKRFKPFGSEQTVLCDLSHSRCWNTRLWQDVILVICHALDILPLPEVLNLLSQRPTLLILTAQLPYTVHKHLWMFTSFFLYNQEFSYIWIFATYIMTGTNLTAHNSPALCWNDLKFYAEMQKTSNLKYAKLHFPIFIIGWEKQNVGHYFSTTFIYIQWVK